MYSNGHILICVMYMVADDNEKTKIVTVYGPMAAKGEPFNLQKLRNHTYNVTCDICMMYTLSTCT